MHLRRRRAAVKPVRSGVDEWRGGWILALVSMAGLAISTSHIYTTGIFIGPIEKDLGWSRGQISSGLMVNSVVAILFAPFFGLLMDRLGIRRVGLPGMAIFCGAIMLLSMTGQAIWTWWSIWLILAIGGLLIKPTLWTAAISRQFDAQRGLALAVMLCGSGIGSSFFPVITTKLIAAHGWRTAYLTLGAGAALLVLPLMFVFLRDEDSAALRQERALTRASLPGLSIREALLSSRFLRIASSALLMTIAMAGLNVHFVPFAVSKGLTAGAAAGAVSCVGIASILGRLGTGVLLDRCNGALIGAVSFAVPLVAAALWLGFDGTMSSAIVMAATLGISLGAEIDVIAYLTTRYFGLRNFGTVFGTIAGLLAFGGGVGPTLAGIVYDKTHSYDIFVWGTIPIFLLAAAMIGSLGRYPDLVSSAARAS
jgi:MFS family permease